MNKQQFIEKCSWKKKLFLRPIPKRFNGGPNGVPLPSLDRAWRVGQATKDGVPIELPETGHGMTLPWDSIKEYMDDPMRGDGYGYLN
jgi:hypothetical protein